MLQQTRFAGQPWRSFFAALDRSIARLVDPHCLGSLIAVQLYSLARATAGIDLLSVVSRQEQPEPLTLAGPGSFLHRRYGLYLQHVTVRPPAGWQHIPSRAVW